MKNTDNKLRVVHIPQLRSVKKSFNVEVKDEEQANLVVNTLAGQHLWLLDNNIIHDYSNAIFVEMWDEDTDGNGTPGWMDYHNEYEGLNFGEFAAAYF